jgi:hypothetical protein
LAVSCPLMSARSGQRAGGSITRGLGRHCSAPVGGGAAERERLGDVAAADLRRAVEVGDGARDPQHAVVAARREVHALGRAQQELAPGAIGRRDPVQKTRRPSPPALAAAIAASKGTSDLGAVKRARPRGRFPLLSHSVGRFASTSGVVYIL